MKHLLLAGWVLLMTSDLHADDAAMVGEYLFESVIDSQTSDTSGQGNNAQVRGAVPLRGKVNGLLFDGRDDLIDCGAGESLDFRKQVTVECWVRPDAIPKGEVGIVGKSIGVFMLTYYVDGQCWWYINDGPINTKTGVAPGVWSHVVGTYDGQTLRLYINGEQAGEFPYGQPINGGGNFYIGGMPDRNGYFQGGIAQVRVYNRALAEDEIAARHQGAAATFMRKFAPIQDGQTRTVGDCVVREGRDRTLQFDIAGDTWQIETAISNPSGADRQINVHRTVSAAGHRIEITDTLTNTSDDDIGIRYHNELIAPKPFDDHLLGGAPQAGSRMTAENPSVFVVQTNSRLGWLAEDDVYRLQLEMAAHGNFVKLAANHVGLAPGASHIFRWAVYPYGADADYWTFANQVRRDWKVNSTILGPFDYFDVIYLADLVADPEKLRAYLERKKLKVIAAMPWLDYDNYNFGTGKPTSRDEYRVMMRRFMEAVHAIDPEIKVIGCMEGNLVSLPPEAVQAIHRLAPNKNQNQYLFTDEQLAALRKNEIRWKDCLLMNIAGKYRYELYYRGKPQDTPFVAIAVYAAPGNDQHEYWLDQAKFMLEDVGLDGVYIDQFSMAFNDSQRYSYEKWDGTTVDINAQTGRITRKYTDAGLVGIGARRSLCDYVNSKGAYMLANTFPAAERNQTGIHRFNESEWFTRPNTLADDEQPPLTYYPCKGHFSTPIALGIRPTLRNHEGQYARIVHKGVISYLRHGMLYYHYNTAIPALGSGPGGGDYGIFNHMFPLTPIEIGPGFVIGKERVVTCVSGTYEFSGDQEPTVHAFDLAGRPVDIDVNVQRGEDGWQVQLKLKDWAQTAAIE